MEFVSWNDVLIGLEGREVQKYRVKEINIIKE